MDTLTVTGNRDRVATRRDEMGERRCVPGNTLGSDEPKNANGPSDAEPVNTSKKED